MSARMCGIASWLLVAAVAVGMADRVHAQRRESPRNEVRGVVKTADANNITITIMESRENVMDKTFALAKDVEVAIGSGFGFGRGVFFNEGKLADLVAEVRVTLTLSADQKTVESIVAEEPAVRGQIKAV